MTLQERVKISQLTSIVEDQLGCSPLSDLFHSLFRPGLVLEQVSLEGGDLKKFVSQAQKSGSRLHPRSSRHRE